MNKTDFINRMAQKGSITKKEADMKTELFIETLMDCLVENNIVKFQNFGRFELKTAKERIGRNPKTGQECVIPEHKKVKFTAGSLLVNRIMERKDEMDADED